MSQKTGAWLAVKSLEKMPISHCMGIPGVHVTELYDELAQSPHLTPLLVVHEGGASFMADGLARTSNQLGCLVLVPAAGLTHALSGIGEAYLDGIPLLVICGGVRRGEGAKSYQLHQMDMRSLVAPLTKGQFLVPSHSQVGPILMQAGQLALSGEPGPVFVEIPADILLLQGQGEVPEWPGPLAPPAPNPQAVSEAVRLLKSAQSPGIFAGWGARGAGAELQELAKLLAAPVSTTLQGLSVFPHHHPLHVGMGFSPAAVPAATRAFAECDCLLAVGCRFGEIPTGSFGARIPTKLIHLDINPEVFHKNYPALVTLETDARLGLAQIIQGLQDHRPNPEDRQALVQMIAEQKAAYRESWREHKTDRVNPLLFFEGLKSQLQDGGILVADDGNHCFLAAELYSCDGPPQFICPTDFNAMGYAVPAAMGAKLANPDRRVAAVVGDGGFLMTCMEILTAVNNRLGVVYFVFADGELSQISQAQQVTYHRKTCSLLGNYHLQGIAHATGACYLELNRAAMVGEVMTQAFDLAAQDHPVIVEVKIDVSKPTRFSQGVVKEVFGNFAPSEKLRFMGRSLVRKWRG